MTSYSLPTERHNEHWLRRLNDLRRDMEAVTGEAYGPTKAENLVQYAVEAVERDLVQQDEDDRSISQITQDEVDSIDAAGEEALTAYFEDRNLQRPHPNEEDK